MRFPDDPIYGSFAVCKSYNYDTTGKSNVKECRPGDKSDDENTNQFRRPGNDGKCAYTSYVGGGTSAIQGKNSTENAECGFNIDTDAW